MKRAWYRLVGLNYNPRQRTPLTKGWAWILFYLLAILTLHLIFASLLFGPTFVVLAVAAGCGTYYLARRLQ